MRPIHSLGVEHLQWLGGASVACIAQAEKQQEEVNMPQNGSLEEDHEDQCWRSHNHIKLKLSHRIHGLHESLLSSAFLIDLVGSAIGFLLFAAILSSWALTFAIGGEHVFGHVWKEL
ncbi:UNVERIFIED_CONTAM: hypothetical protein Scaly_0062100 [Sesamum calycinum]|uniref:Uncharacterized protein n=1 Tax=Sesamum calycinum TaxID=2727403 RepID=A0AAW2SUR6_9LAMI